MPSPNPVCHFFPPLFVSPWPSWFSSFVALLLLTDACHHCSWTWLAAQFLPLEKTMSIFWSLDLLTLLLLVKPFIFPTLICKWSRPCHSREYVLCELASTPSPGDVALQNGEVRLLLNTIYWKQNHCSNKYIVQVHISEFTETNANRTKAVRADSSKCGKGPRRSIQTAAVSSDHFQEETAQRGLLHCIFPTDVHSLTFYI